MEPREFEMFHNASTSAFEKARILRLHLTETEDLLWQALRNRKCNGLKFRRQHPFGEYILDFFCFEKKLVVEIDGDYHLLKDQREYDENRTAFLEESGLKVIRFTNEEVKSELSKILEEIKNIIS